MLRRKAMIVGKRISTIGRLIHGGICIINRVVRAFIGIWITMVRVRGRVMAIDEMVWRIVWVLLVRRSAICSSSIVEVVLG
jgi:hypothetical protein